MTMIIRAVSPEDYKEINEIRCMIGVRENILGRISERLEQSKEFIQSLGSNDHLLVAEIKEEDKNKVVGVIGLNINSNPRTKHTASLGMMVHKAYQGNGIGKKLMSEILDLADNWLMLVRIELGVFTDNEKAIKLYEKFGFEIEGTKKYAAIKNGRYADEYIMARYKNI
ncbi:GNAT family N-acetyltransferase [Clostridium botulinum]|uniref:Acetyltransferase, GNAT family n=1 Tax=Clostridium botulinum (strain Langeland / NCTC 10281 / Type F) TaxID=441772 RepID=A7GI31_CLOBL|nr:GNAT family N-acetyltransferase [Clostridium botulinum]ABS40969.1 acetyltransferase, GNAT family [Clostridium botulinum F str. Langeland]ADG00805.1 acetyltransferase, GNAT family [Clostridium botulinum F str. 230613]KKM40686.1 GNAT family acetyltransferase [Clostridium botulinum]MBY6794338.1 GNAT family N-acetyltransferase [Clostridium botulinum]MBY6938126.1 GNAT family N-acetyltransferase [Clostridium botulinum]